jgi:hypothetical protein
MRRLPILSFILFFLALIGSASADVLSKEVLATKEAFDKAGATKCSQAIADTLQFVAKNRGVTVNRQWFTKGANEKPVTVQFLVLGDKESYSRSGSITLTPVGNQCIGAYVYTTVSPAQNCKSFMEKGGFTADETWEKGLTDANGDGGNTYFLSLKPNGDVVLVFNDVAGGCSLTRQETLMLNAVK